MSQSQFLKHEEKHYMSKKSESRSWILTQSADKITFDDLQKALSDYTYIGQMEQGKKGGEQGFKHYQIYIENPVSIRFSTLKKKLPNAHIEPRKGSKKEAFDYVTKSDTKIGEVFGNGDIDLTNEQGKRNDLLEIISELEQGATLDEIRLKYKSQYFMYQNKIKSYLQAILETRFKNIFRTVTTTYIFGSTGKGKTRYVMDKYGYENVYRITNYTHPFDMYNGQKIVVFEEFRSSLKIEQMLNYLDGYPLTLPARYGDKIACFDTIYIITNIPLASQYTNIQVEQAETYKALLRRIGFIWNCDKQTEPVKFTQNKSIIHGLTPINDADFPFF